MGHPVVSGLFKSLKWLVTNTPHAPVTATAVKYAVNDAVNDAVSDGVKIDMSVTDTTVVVNVIELFYVANLENPDTRKMVSARTDLFTRSEQFLSTV